ncbi:DUF5926 family protein [Corynebacterium doosanense]|uniref:Preprotein translocase subunit SecA n=1 Tax=Corynebacterium doosanense CAU 212 = DSM 45436 TaxID=558173 RepID=A0A097IIS4_9CORY|nr:DUF5926 family protein [Corynebacterium doosanense]AIT62029.1 preprotein translocase subunit SecA [Corynebacterium doosanense CAU 212 = DSM 45436]
MAKKNRKNEQDQNLPEGMSRRQAKLAARAAEREALDKDPRPFGGLAAEADLVALQEFVPAGTATVPLKGSDRTVTLGTVLPGAGAGLVRDEQFGGDALVGLQVQKRSHNPGRDLAYALNWAANAAPGETIESTVADGNQPKLTDLIDADTTLDITVHDDFNWWAPEGGQVPFEVQQAIQRSNETIAPTRRVTANVPGSAWWTNPGGGKAYLRWVRIDDNESALLSALARVAARGDLHVGENTKFAGVFRTHGVIVPVFDLHDTDKAAEEYNAELERVNTAIEAELKNDEQLTAEERRQLENIKSRQVTIR